MHEDIPELDTKGLRDFGVVTGAIIAGLFGLVIPFLFSLNYPIWPWVIATVLLVWAMIAPDSLNHPYHWWMRLGMAIGWVMNRVVLSMVFFVVMLPTGYIMRALGNDPMSRKMDKEQNSYRVESKPTKPDQMDRPY
jgi:hypothetical protein